MSDCGSCLQAIAFEKLQKPELQIRGVMRIIQKYFFLFLNENICCDPSLEPSRRDGSNDGHKICFYGEIWLIIPKLSLFPPLIWGTEKLCSFSGAVA